MLKRSRPSYPRWRFNSQLRDWTSANWPRLLVGISLFAVPAAVLAFWLDGYLLGLLQGVFVALCVLAVTTAFLTQTNTIGQLAGAWGEDLTRDELKKARRRKVIWGSVGGIEIHSGDIDHLVITRRGAIVMVDSKWRNDPDTATLERDSATALEAARRAQLVLRSIQRPTTVTPVVAVWGAGRRRIPPIREGHVPIVTGDELISWLRQLPSGPIEPRMARQMLHDLKAFKSRVRPVRSAR